MTPVLKAHKITNNLFNPYLLFKLKLINYISIYRIIVEKRVHHEVHLQSICLAICAFYLFIIDSFNKSRYMCQVRSSFKRGKSILTTFVTEGWAVVANPDVIMMVGTYSCRICNTVGNPVRASFRRKKMWWNIWFLNYTTVH